MALRQVSSVRGDFVGNDAVFHILLVGQTKVLFGSDVTQHGGPEPANHRRTDR